MDISVIGAGDLVSLEAHGDAWDALAASSPPYFPTCSHAYISAYLAGALEAADGWSVFFAYDDDRLVGVLPLVVDSRSHLGVSAQMLGTPSNEDTFGVAPLLLAGREARVLDALLAAAWNAYPSVRFIEVCDVSSRLPLTDFSAGQMTLEVSRRVGRFISTTGSHEEYQAALSKNFKKNQRKAFNKLNKLPEVEYEFIKGDEGNTEYLDEFMRVEALSWKGREGTAVSCSEKMTAYYRGLTESLSRLGWLEWHVLRTEGKIIAINLTIRFHRSVVILKLGYDDEYSKCSPGGMLMQEQVARCFADDSIDEIDIITDAKWYDDWNMETRDYRHLRYYDRSSLASLVLGYFPDRVKAAIRGSETLSGLIRKVRGR